MQIIYKVMNLQTLTIILIKEIVWIRIQVTTIQLAVYGIRTTLYPKLTKKSKNNNKDRSVCLGNSWCLTKKPKIRPNNGMARKILLIESLTHSKTSFYIQKMTTNFKTNNNKTMNNKCNHKRKMMIWILRIKTNQTLTMIHKTKAFNRVCKQTCLKAMVTCSSQSMKTKPVLWSYSINLNHSTMMTLSSFLKSVFIVTTFPMNLKEGIMLTINATIRIKHK